MASTPRKGSRPAAEEDHRAACPFSVTVDKAAVRVQQPPPESKKRKRDVLEDDKKGLIQVSPFKPAGKFKTHSSLDVYYSVEPRKEWEGMTRYSSFVLHGAKHINGDYVCVANETTIARQNKQAEKGKRRPQNPNDFWIARIQEVRAADEHHVYARVAWMYSPDEIPPNTIYEKKPVSGRQPYHGKYELIASNHMDIINVITVAKKAEVEHWIESNDDDLLNVFYWRQAFDCRTLQLSSINLICKCETPGNPDKTLVGCMNQQCNLWMHDHCILDDVLMKVFNRLGATKPHIPELAVAERQTDDDSRSSVTESTSALTMNGHEGTPTETDASTPVPRQPPKKKGRRKKVPDKKPYEGLFEAKLEMNDGLTTWVITDLRENVTGGDKTWNEFAYCFHCGRLID